MNHIICYGTHTPPSLTGLHHTTESYLEVPSVDPDCRLWEAVGAYEAEVEGPDAVVLGQRQGPEGTVKGAPGTGDPTLVHQELAVVQPDPRHLGRQTHTHTLLSPRLTPWPHPQEAKLSFAPPTGTKTLFCPTHKKQEKKRSANSSHPHWSRASCKV